MKSFPITPEVQQSDANPDALPTAEMLLSMPEFVTGTVMFGYPTPTLYHSDGKTLHLNPKALRAYGKAEDGK